MKRIKIVNLLSADSTMGSIIVKGWIRTRRSSKEFSFLEINDGSSLKGIQVVADISLSNYEEIEKITTGSAVSVTGTMVESMGKGQKWEIQAESVEVISLAPENFPLQKKRHTDEFLRTIAHLRPRTNKYGAIFRMRSELSCAIHDFYRGKGFKFLHTPIITGSDCEGAGEMFRLTTMDPGAPPMSDGKVDYSQDFFGKETNLTVSGQLSAEMFALSLGDVYTFGPTFRAENSNTARHVAEFWMLEPEMAFCDLEGNMDHAEELVKFLVKTVIERCPDDFELFSKFVDKGLSNSMDTIISSEFERLPYSEAVNILQRTNKKFEYAVEYGIDLQTEHERFLAEEYCKKPVIVYDYPETIKPFYMRVNDDGKTVAAMDLLVPRIGELVGGSQREERLDVLTGRMDQMGMNKKDYWWYLDSRKFGSVPHSGFGMGFERMLMLVTGITNIRDVIPFPRTPGSIDF